MRKNDYLCDLTPLIFIHIKSFNEKIFSDNPYNS